jgi:hypothetical protein
MRNMLCLALAAGLAAGAMAAEKAEAAPPPCADGSHRCHEMLVRHGCITTFRKSNNRRCRTQVSSRRLDRLCTHTSTWVCAKWMN